MRISDWSSDVCSSDLTDLGELKIQMSGAGAGDYTYTANPAVEHGPEGSPTDDVISDSFTYVVVDGDGDTASANLVINIKDGEPEATPATISATVEEEHLPGGNEDTAPGADQDAAGDFHPTPAPVGGTHAPL